MRKLMLLSVIICLAVAGPVFAQANIGIEINEMWQECDSVQCNFVINDSSESDEGMILIEIKNSMDSTVAGNIMFYHPPMINHVCTIYVPLFTQTFGSHTCEITAYNTDGGQGINNIKDIDLMICTIGIETAESQWCHAVILSENLLVSINNQDATLVTVFDMQGKILMETKIFGTTLLPFDVPVGIYSLIVQQSSATKVFKLTATDW